MAEKKEKGLKKVKELIDLMIKNDLVEVEIVDGDNKILLKRPQPGQPVVTQVPVAAVAPAVAAAAPVEEPHGQAEVIPSPIVGTFYAAPSPDSEPYVKVGSHVSEDTVVCIIEAMKVMNEIKAQASGTIVEICCKAGQAVEFDEPLFKIKSD
jgi:acetyl-CoA carboxylase biotin carboxyl carrier protein